MQNIVLFKNNELITTSEIIAQGIAREHKNVIELIDSNIEELQELGQVTFETRAGYQGSKIRIAILNEPQTTLLFTFMRNIGIIKNFKIALVKEFFRMRGALTQQQNTPAPQSLPTNYLEALKALVVSEERAILIEAQRDEAIAKRAEIGSKREATAMATASKAVREVNKLKEQLDLSTSYASTKCVESAYKDIKFKWQPLKKASIEMGLPINKVHDQNYGSINAYHADVWQRVYQIDIKEIR